MRGTLTRALCAGEGEEAPVKKKVVYGKRKPAPKKPAANAEEEAAREAATAAAEQAAKQQAEEQQRLAAAQVRASCVAAWTAAGQCSVQLGLPWCQLARAAGVPQVQDALASSPVWWSMLDLCQLPGFCSKICCCWLG